MKKANAIRLNRNFARIFIIGLALLVLISACSAANPGVTQGPILTPAPTQSGTSQPLDKVVITWQRDGGIAGFCDRITIRSGGIAQVSSCKQNSTRVIVLAADKLGQLNQWLKNLKGFTYQHADQAVADAMSINLVFSGDGIKEATESDRQAILDLVSQIATQSNP